MPVRTVPRGAVAPRDGREPALQLREAPTGEAREVAERILDAALVLVARWGVTKTSLADVAKAAGCSRATVYRAFPGGKTHLFQSLGQRELEAYRQAVADVIDTAEDFDDALTRALVVASRLLHDHDAAQFIVEHEPELLLPFLGFNQVDVLYRAVAASLAPHLERFVPAERAEWAAEWCSRLFITFVFNPAPDTDLGHVDDARDLVARFVSPAFR